MKHRAALTRDIEAGMTEPPRFVVLEASSVEFGQDAPLVFRDAQGDIVAVFRD